VLGILKVIAGNAASAPATVRLPGQVPEPARFRGRVVIDPAKCVACGTCAYVCVSNAITGSDSGEAYAWAYEPGRCAFCARCLDHCAGGALSMEEQAAPAYTRVGELRREANVHFPRCAGCGATRRPTSEPFLERAFLHVTASTRQLVKLCERCRRREAQRGLAAAAGVDLPGGRGEGKP
jgi:ferredoxin